MTEHVRSIGDAARAATTADLDVLVGLCGRFHEELQSARGGPTMVTDYAIDAIDEISLTQALSSPHSHVIVGTYDEVPVGLAIVESGERSESGALQRAAIRVFFVEEQARRVGVGEAIFNRVISWCETQGIQEIDVSTLPGDRETKSFLETQGFRARMLIMHRELG